MYHMLLPVGHNFFPCQSNETHIFHSPQDLCIKVSKIYSSFPLKLLHKFGLPNASSAWADRDPFSSIKTSC